MMRGMLLVLASLAAPPLAAETIYKWVDDEGRTHYSQEKPPGERAKPVDLRPPNLIPGLSAEERQKARELDAKEAAAQKAAAKQPSQNPPPLARPARNLADEVDKVECALNPEVCPMVEPPPDAPVPRDDPVGRSAAPMVKP